MTEKLNAPQAYELLEKIVAKRGKDFVYPDKWRLDKTEESTCLYFLNNGAPGCIVGMVLADIGVTRRDLKANNVHDDETVDSSDMFKEYFTRDALTILGIAQSRQDMKGTWGESLTDAAEVLKIVKEGRNE